MTGSGSWSRAYIGKAEVLAELFAPLRAKLEGKIVNTPIRILADAGYPPPNHAGVGRQVHQGSTGASAF